MKTSTPRAPRKPSYAAVKTIDIFKQPKPLTYANMGYAMSTPAPLQDPCAYASSVSGPNPSTRPANRIVQCLEPTFSETEAKRSHNGPHSAKRSATGDPAIALAKEHDIEKFKSTMMVAGVPVGEYQARQLSRSADGASSRTSGSNSASASGDITILGDADEIAMNTTTMLVTPMRRAFAGPQGSTAKRQRTMRHSEGDLSTDTVKSVLRLVDESLVDTPERNVAVTPKVFRALPGPSPRDQGPTYAYGAETRTEKYGGLLPKLSMTLTPFNMTRL